ncbi:hypothetical protein HYG86_03005 [Alkalicella caledoniensis]|uniref:Uncharacterized protein n=1 Tax=Alkalicella caledoniensis TaxID=2731377 RepID=A0A7G9W540_ALKCA|nr:hypothetical protein [Alkalicella caledoniensis]QNO13802.1 hypothetical protein HYG86_03005 [Alkalicella caledoniensis]
MKKKIFLGIVVGALLLLTYRVVFPTYGNTITSQWKTMNKIYVVDRVNEKRVTIRDEDIIRSIMFDHADMRLMRWDSGIFLLDYKYRIQVYNDVYTSPYTFSFSLDENDMYARGHYKILGENTLFDYIESLDLEWEDDN